MRYLEVVPLPVLGYGMVGPAIAALGTGVIAEVTVTLDPGSRVVFFTDGLVERRAESIDEGLERLAGAARDGLGLSPEELSKHLLGAMLGVEQRGDDVALLLISIDP